MRRTFSLTTRKVTRPANILRVASSCFLLTVAGASALQAQVGGAGESRQLIEVLNGMLAGPEDRIRPARTPIPSGDYTLCTLPPELIYRNMVAGTELSKAEARPLFSGWSAYLTATSQSLSRSRRADRLSELRVRAMLDRDIRQTIGQYGIDEPTSPAMKHYQALVWAASCLIDRSNTGFVRQFLAHRSWPRGSDPSDPASASHSLFLLLQHAVLTPRDREQLLSTAEAAHRRRLIAPFDYARIVDRATQELHGFQKYGTQVSLVESRRVVEGALGCRSTLNQNRSLLGLEPLAAEVEVRLQGGEACPETR